MQHKHIKTHFLKHFHAEGILPAVAVFVLLGGLLGYQFWQARTLEGRVSILTTELASTTASLAQNIQDLSLNVTDLRAQTVGISSTLSSAQQDIDAVNSKVGGVAQTVGTLQKLAETDPELLKKYSKVYFMNENYVPAHLIEIPAEYLYNEKDPQEFIAEAWPRLMSMINAAKATNVELYVKSAFRSFGEQQSLKNKYTVVYGAGSANSFSADQGYSEHQLGTTVDFITTGLGGQLEGFEKTQPYLWLLNNAYRYGFVLSYPENNGYYVYEPWHWRFVGIGLATYLHDNNLKFYDMDQREIDRFLVTLFD